MWIEPGDGHSFGSLLAPGEALSPPSLVLLLVLLVLVTPKVNGGEVELAGEELAEPGLTPNLNAGALELLSLVVFSLTPNLNDVVVGEAGARGRAPSLREATPEDDRGGGLARGPCARSALGSAPAPRSPFPRELAPRKQAVTLSVRRSSSGRGCGSRRVLP